MDVGLILTGSGVVHAIDLDTSKAVCGNTRYRTYQQFAISDHVPTGPTACTECVRIVNK